MTDDAAVILSQWQREAVARWSNLPPANAKRQECEHCGRSLIIVCDEAEIAETCGNLWRKRGRMTAGMRGEQ